jgi:hypothetical protein
MNIGFGHDLATELIAEANDPHQRAQEYNLTLDLNFHDGLKLKSNPN